MAVVLQNDAEYKNFQPQKKYWLSGCSAGGIFSVYLLDLKRIKGSVGQVGLNEEIRGLPGTGEETILT